MGLFHMVYEPNLRALLDGIKIFEREHPSINVRLTCRCEHIRRAGPGRLESGDRFAIRRRSPGQRGHGERGPALHADPLWRSV